MDLSPFISSAELNPPDPTDKSSAPDTLIPFAIQSLFEIEHIEECALQLDNGKGSDSDVVLADKTTMTTSYLEEEASKGLTCLLTVDSKTVEQTYPWDAAGLCLYFPKGPLPDEVNGKEIKLEVTISGSYHFPPNTKPVSAIYSITTDVPIEATLELEHCYRGKQKDLVFVYCQSRQPPFDFILATKENYKYSFTANNGVIKIQHFSHWAIVVLVDWLDKARSWFGFRDDILLKIIPFYQVEVSHVKVDLVIVRGLSAHVKVRGHNKSDSVMLIVMIVFYRWWRCSMVVGDKAHASIMSGLRTTALQ